MEGEGVVLTATTCRPFHITGLIVADSDVYACIRGKGDGLLGQPVNSCGSIQRQEVTAQVELIVGLTREANNVWLGSCQ